MKGISDLLLRSSFYLPICRAPSRSICHPNGLDYKSALNPIKHNFLKAVIRKECKVAIKRGSKYLDKLFTCLACRSFGSLEIKFLVLISKGCVRNSKTGVHSLIGNLNIGKISNLWMHCQKITKNTPSDLSLYLSVHCGSNSNIP